MLQCAVMFDCYIHVEDLCWGSEVLQCGMMFDCCILWTCVGGGGCYNVLSCLTVAY